MIYNLNFLNCNKCINGYLCQKKCFVRYGYHNIVNKNIDYTIENKTTSLMTITETGSQRSCTIVHFSSQP